MGLMIKQRVMADGCLKWQCSTNRYSHLRSRYEIRRKFSGKYVLVK